MKRLVLATFLALAGPAYAQATVNCHETSGADCKKQPQRALPTSVDEYLALREKIGTSPTGGAALFLYALMVQEKNAALGDKLVVLALYEDLLTKTGGDGTYKGYVWDRGPGYHIDRIKARPHIPRSFAVGATAANHYAMDPARVGLLFRAQSRYVPDPATGEAKVFACTSGAATCRPITLRRNDKGYWKVKEFSTISVDIQPPAPRGPRPSDEL